MVIHPPPNTPPSPGNDLNTPPRGAPCDCERASRCQKLIVNTQEKEPAVAGKAETLACRFVGVAEVIFDLKIRVAVGNVIQIATQHHAIRAPARVLDTCEGTSFDVR